MEEPKLLTFFSESGFIHGCKQLYTNATTDTTMLHMLRPRMLRRARNPTVFQNPYYEHISYPDDSFSSIRRNLIGELPAWFFICTEEILKQNQYDLISLKSKRAGTNGTRTKKEIILEIFREFILLLSKPVRQTEVSVIEKRDA